MSNPYEAPTTTRLADPAGTGPPRLSIGTYVMAVVSGLFVTGGVLIVVPFAPLFVGDLLTRVPPPLLATVPVVAVALGIASGWQSVRQARRKLEARRDRPAA